MNWTWNVRSSDGAMNGLEFARCTTAGGFGRVLIHAAPAHARIEIIDGDDRVVARADLERSGDYSPMTLIELDGPAMRRSEVWPDQDMYGLPVLLAGGEVWRYCDETAKYCVGDKLDDPIARRIMQELRKAPPEGLSRSAIYRIWNGRTMNRGEIDKSLVWVSHAGVARAERVETGGRPTEKWYAC